MKPGQTEMKRDYYKDVTTEKPDGKQTLENYGRFESNYQQRQVDNVKRGDYVIPAKSMNTMRKQIFIFPFIYFSIIVGYEFTHKPDLFNTTTLGRAAA